jgi:hypothetical protein
LEDGLRGLPAALRARRRRLPELLAEAGGRLGMSRVGVAMDVVWDLVVFLALVVVGLLVLSLLARRR